MKMRTSKPIKITRSKKLRKYILGKTFTDNLEIKVERHSLAVVVTDASPCEREVVNFIYKREAS